MEARPDAREEAPVAITVGSVEVDVIPNTRGIYARLRAGLVLKLRRALETRPERR